jgi:hypothetical protein
MYEDCGVRKDGSHEAIILVFIHAVFAVVIMVSDIVRRIADERGVVGLDCPVEQFLDLAVIKGHGSLLEVGFHGRKGFTN